ncbi:MAG TPA: hypothetical protein VMF53_06690 [Alphaproteobacteria bacterium]|nr:hypothetical protein [Alphaproteobacteria bacterium]
MLRILAFLMAFGAIAAARGAELPTFDPAVVCAKAPIDQARRACIDNEGHMRAALAAEGLDDRLMAFCTAYAVYHRNGYMGMMECVLQTRHEEQVAQLENAWGLLGSNYCVKTFPEGQSTEAEFLHCREAERVARLEFEVRDAPYPAPAFSACLSKAQAAGKSFVMLNDCLGGAASK